MLRNLFLGSVSPQILHAANDGTGGGGGDDAAAAEAARLAAEAAGGDGAGSDDGSGGDEAAAAKAAADAAAAVAKATQPAKPAKDWRDREIAKKHAQIKERDAELAALREQLEATTRRATPAAADDPAAVEAARVAEAAAARTAPRVPAQSDDARIEARARQLAAAQTAEEQLAVAFTAGRAAHGGEWDGAMDNIRTLGGFDPDTMTDILATDNPSQVLFELGKTPERFQEVMELPPAKRRAQLVKIGMAPPLTPPKKAVSDAPAPVDPIAPGGNVLGAPKFDLYDQKIPFGSWEKSPFEAQKSDSDRNDEKWFAARRAEKEKSVGRPWSKQR